MTPELKDDALRWADILGEDYDHASPDFFPRTRGKIVALADLVDVVFVGDETTAEAFAARADARMGNFAPGRYVWLLAHVVRLEPTPHRGMMGLWDVRPEVAARLVAA